MYNQIKETYGVHCPENSKQRREEPIKENKNKNKKKNLVCYTIFFLYQIKSNTHNTYYLCKIPIKYFC